MATAVLREGSEVVLVLYRIAASGHEGWAALMLGGALGVGLGAVVSFLLYCGLVARPMHAVVGYSDRPMGIQLVAYLAVLAALVAGAHLIRGGQPPRPGNIAQHRTS